MTEQVLCTNALALRIVPCFCLRWCIMHYLVLLSITVNVEHPCTAFRTTSHHLLTPPTMLVPTFFFFFLIAFWIAAYIFKTCIGAWAHVIVVEAVVEVIEEVVKLAHQVAIKGIARCAPPPPFFFFFLSPLTLPRANAELVVIATGIPTDPNTMEFRCMGDAFMHLVSIFGKIVTLGIVIHVLKYVVCFFFFSLNPSLTVCYVACRFSPECAHLGDDGIAPHGDSSSADDNNDDDNDDDDDNGDPPTRTCKRQ